MKCEVVKLMRYFSREEKGKTDQEESNGQEPSETLQLISSILQAGLTSLEVTREIGDAPSEWSLFKTSIVKTAAEICGAGLHKTGHCHCQFTKPSYAWNGLFN
ncbi:hypothetical protein EYF80_026499 [Liparis tanakae]|uniref:Uncharacterized protein n=1 Tax=Liparis tanakae TaxID=230148 RepID=A0A4Z2HBK0_9TELE|nr:hypothetical protein EYF80_026499 [Liparis tanakae]